MDNAPAVPPVATPSTTVAAAPTERPLGVTILAILAALGAVGALFAALGAFAIGGLAGAASNRGIYALLGAAAGVVFLLLAALYAASAWGLWTRQRWAWFAAIVAAGFGLLLGLLNLPAGIFQILVSGVIGWYLLTPPIQRWFGVWYNVPWNKTS